MGLLVGLGLLIIGGILFVVLKELFLTALAFAAVFAAIGWLMTGQSEWGAIIGGVIGAVVGLGVEAKRMFGKS